MYNTTKREEADRYATGLLFHSTCSLTHFLRQNGRGYGISDSSPCPLKIFFYAHAGIVRSKHESDDPLHSVPRKFSHALLNNLNYYEGISSLKGPASRASVHSPADAPRPLRCKYKEE